MTKDFPKTEETQAEYFVIHSLSLSTVKLEVKSMSTSTERLNECCAIEFRQWNAKMKGNPFRLSAYVFYTLHHWIDKKNESMFMVADHRKSFSLYEQGTPPPSNSNLGHCFSKGMVLSLKNCRCFSLVNGGDRYLVMRWTELPEWVAACLML